MSRLRRVNFVLLGPVALAVLVAALVVGVSHETTTQAGEAYRLGLVATPSQKIAGYHDKGEDSHYCDGCTPPLTNSGSGSVVSTSGPAGFTITPIFWEPAGASAANQIPASYQSIISGYISNVAAASGTTSNVYSIATEYYSNIAGVKTPVTYNITAGTPIIDTNKLPPSGCVANAANGYTSCVSDAQLRTELTKVLTANGLPSDLAHFYPVFFPPNTETEGAGGPSGGNSDSSYCGYHGAYVSGSGETVYGNEPYETSGCDGGEAPNGNVIADGAVGVLSHEVSETMTDPNGSGILSGPAWGDSTGHEIGDECSGYYGPPIGSTDPSNPNTTAYNQVINGGKYYTQTEFSNAAFAKLGIGNGCQQNEAAATASINRAKARPDDIGDVVATVTNDAFPNTLAANGTSTSTLDMSVADADGNAVSGDPVNYSVYAITGNGYCGTLSAPSATTDDTGHASVIYTASRSQVVCAVVANELDGGQGATGMIYQGLYQYQAIRASDNFPTTLTLGKAAYFQTSFHNPSMTPQNDARIQFGVFPGDGATDNVDSSQMTLSYSTTGLFGTYTPVDLSGSTIDDGEIQGVVLPAGGVTIPARSTLRVWYKVTLDPSISTAGGGAGLAFESYLDQIDPASGALSTFGDTLAHQTTVLPAS
jgi:hypothetical protein